jgi:hydrogenase nickel incorporation protein HypA/HybF
MHETSVMDSLMRTILELAYKEQGKKITKIQVKLGALSHMSPEYFKGHFENTSIESDPD